MKLNLPNSLSLLRIFLVPVPRRRAPDQIRWAGDRRARDLSDRDGDRLSGRLARAAARADHDARHAARPDRRQAPDFRRLHLLGRVGSGPRLDGRRRGRPRVRGHGAAIDRFGARESSSPRRVWAKAKMASQITAISLLDPFRAVSTGVVLPGKIALWVVVAVAIISGAQYFARLSRANRLARSAAAAAAGPLEVKRVADERCRCRILSASRAAAESARWVSLPRGT